MRRVSLILGAALVASTAAAAAQDLTKLTGQQQLGFRLFGQDCGVCHTPPTITSKLYGPALTKDLVKGNEAAIRKFISVGDQKMPGFQYYYTPEQIDAVVDYLSTVTTPPGSPMTPAKTPASAH